MAVLSEVNHPHIVQVRARGAVGKALIGSLV
jgi:hypothetical protein